MSEFNQNIMIIILSSLTIISLIYYFLYYKIEFAFIVEIYQDDVTNNPGLKITIKEANKKGHIKYKLITKDDDGNLSETKPTTYEDFTSIEVPVESIESENYITYDINDLEHGTKYVLFLIFKDDNSDNYIIKETRELAIHNTCKSVTMNLDGSTNCSSGFTERVSNRDTFCLGFDCDIETRESRDHSNCCCSLNSSTCDGSTKPVAFKIHKDNSKYDLRAQNLLKQRVVPENNFDSNYLTLFAYLNSHKFLFHHRILNQS